jgi:ribosomal protein S14
MRWAADHRRSRAPGDADAGSAIGVEIRRRNPPGTIYSLDMTQASEKGDPRCSRCGEPVADLKLQTCMICRSLFCRNCAVEGYGRSFCSDVCRGFFFHGDGDETEEDF